jgi:hypothetical protein
MLATSLRDLSERYDYYGKVLGHFRGNPPFLELTSGRWLVVYGRFPNRSTHRP